MRAPGHYRRYVNARGGRRLSVCGLRSRPPAPEPVRAATLRGFAWFSSVALVAVVFFSLYVAVRPPALPDDPRRRPPVAAVARYDFADFVNAAR
jgi:hypothetical protein